jgi:hypothetical protein
MPPSTTSLRVHVLLKPRNVPPRLMSAFAYLRGPMSTRDGRLRSESTQTYTRSTHIGGKNCDGISGLEWRQDCHPRFLAAAPGAFQPALTGPQASCSAALDHLRPAQRPSGSASSAIDHHAGADAYQVGRPAITAAETIRGHRKLANVCIRPNSDISNWGSREGPTI